MIELLYDRRYAETGWGSNPNRLLIRPLDFTEIRGLAMKATRTCSIDGCGRVEHLRELCSTHYTKQWRDGRKHCSVDGCDKPQHARGWCATHNWRWKKTGTVGTAKRRAEPRTGLCRIEACLRTDDGSLGLCRPHYQRQRKAAVDAAMVAMCSVNDCGRPAHSRGWCTMHYQRWSDHGALTLPVRPVLACSVAACRRVYKGHGFCTMHYQRWSEHGSPFVLGRTGRPRVSTTPTTYRALHARVRRMRGLASTYPCDHCWHTRAYHWAYDHSDPNEKMSLGNGPFSLDEARYIPLCIPCHSTFDAAHRQLWGPNASR